MGEREEEEEGEGGKRDLQGLFGGRGRQGGIMILN